MICDEFYWLGSGGDHHDAKATDSTSKYSYHVKGDLQTSPKMAIALALTILALLRRDTL